ncbi:MAG: hypothetical protein JJU34_12240 [Lunatimonas sp.]|uniref:hypothetical protein n=1 Tax=Lunatimonas sp. TaxID=2060141 RepID=UPI00263B0FC0|nr:hypothetical protein [Lunatimonas sp.]MCC5938042.1 hypothetical protein [Lunatimonas sp.]
MEEHKVKVLKLFEVQLEEGKSLFEDLTRKIRSKKAIALEEKLFFFQTFLELLGKIHFKEKTLSLKLFSPFDLIFRNTKKIHHIKLIEQQLLLYQEALKESYPSYLDEIDKHKKSIYNDVFDTIVAAPLKIWEDLYVTVYNYTKNLTPLQLNTSSNQIINEEIDFSQFDVKNEPDPQSIKNVYESLQKIILLERVRMSGGLNPVFTFPVHEKINTLTLSKYAWYQNHLFFQHFIHYLRDKEQLEKKYLSLAKHTKKQHKALTNDVINMSDVLFTKVFQ